MHERTVAMVLTGGAAEGGFAAQGVNYKALVPFAGRPLADHIVRALQASAVEKVFILTPRDAGLQAALTPHPKNVFLEYGGQRRSLTLTLCRGIEHLLDHYGPDKLRQLNVMWMPCDIPLVRTEHLDGLLAQAHQPDRDGLCTIVPHRLLAARLPGRRFPNVYLKDLGERYALQSVLFVNGRLYAYATTRQHPDVRIVMTDSFGEPIPGLFPGIDEVRERRHGLFGAPRFVNEFIVRRLPRRDVAASVPRFLYQLARRRLTVERISEYLFRAMRVRGGAVISHAAEFSADVDTPEDVERYMALPRAGDPPGCPS